LIAHGADVSVVMVKELTNSHFAVVRGRDACVELLLAAGADVNARCDVNASIRDASDLSPLNLQLVIPEPFFTIAHSLLTFPDIDTETLMGTGFAPLHSAAMKGDDAVVKFSMTRGARANPKQKPLWIIPNVCASVRGHKAVVEILRAHGTGSSKSKSIPLSIGFIQFLMLESEDKTREMIEARAQRDTKMITIHF